MRVFLDANVLFAAAKEDSHVARLAALITQEARAVSCRYAMEEARRNIVIKRPQWLAALENLSARIEIVETVDFPLEVELDKKDTPILCSAIRAGCDYLVTGDRRDFGHLYDKIVGGVRIVSLTAMAEILLDRRTKK